MKIEAIIPAAGLGLRLKPTTNKPLIEIGGRPILIHTLTTLEKHPLIQNIILVVNHLDLNMAKRKIKQYHLKKVKDVILGGQTRKESVEKGLNRLDKDTTLVLIHDGVRPFVNKETITSAIHLAMKLDAVVVGVPVKATLKKIYTDSNIPFVDTTLDRKSLWEIQTPQVFKKELILKAYENFRQMEATDDASLVERLGIKVAVAIGSYLNIKITTSEDLIFAEAILKAQK